MSEHIAFPAEGIRYLIIEEMTRDGQVWGTADATEIQITYLPRGREQKPLFSVEDEAAHLSEAAIQRINLPAATAITVKRAYGDLHVRGLTSDVNLETVHGDLRVSSLSGTTRVARVDGDFRADEVADLRLLGTCAGDLRFEGGSVLEAETVAGDVRVSGATEVRMGHIHGDLLAERVDGSLQAERISGDARLNSVAGEVSLLALSGDLRVSGLPAGLSAPQVQGDATLQGPFGPGGRYSLTTSGDVSLLLPVDADARLVVRAHGRIRSDLQLAPAADGTPTFTATVGQGAARINVTSGGDMRITQAGAAGPRVTADVRGSASPEDLRNLGDRIRQQVMTSLAAAGISPESGPGGWSGRGPKPGKPARPAPPTPPRPPAPPAPPRATSAEELHILKMVEDGTITAEQAEMLLKAMEG